MDGVVRNICVVQNFAFQNLKNQLSEVSYKANGEERKLADSVSISLGAGY